MRNGSGTYIPPSGSWTNPVENQSATRPDWIALLADLSAAITQSVSRDGQSPMTGDLQMGGYKVKDQGAATGAGQSLVFEQLFDQGVEADLASATTCDIGAQTTNFLRITGTTTITSFGSNFKGPRFLRFAGAVTLTNSSTLVLPSGTNFTTAAGDTCIVVPKATGGTADGWVVVYASAASKVAVLSAAYPIGSLYFNATENTNPATLLGFGTWIRTNEGQFPVGYSTSDATFGTAGGQGGSKDAIVVTHTHGSGATGSASISGSFPTAATGGSYSGVFTKSTGYSGNGGEPQTNYQVNMDATHTHSISSTGSSGANANLPPYKIWYMWQRTA